MCQKDSRGPALGALGGPEQGQRALSVKAGDSKHFRFCGLDRLCCDCSDMPRPRRSGHRQYRDEQA